MTAPVFGSLVPLVGRVNTSVLAINQVRWFKWSLFYQEYVDQGYADIHDPTEPGVVVALKIDGTVATYSALPTTGLVAGTVFVVSDTGHAYVWNGSAWPAQNAGIAIQGPRGHTGNGVESVSVSGNALVFRMTDGNDLPPIYLQVLADLQSAVQVAQDASSAAVTARDEVDGIVHYLNEEVVPDIATNAQSARVAAEEAGQHLQGASEAAVAADGHRGDAATAADAAAADRLAVVELRDQTGDARDATIDARDVALAAASDIGEAVTHVDQVKIDTEAARDAAVEARLGAETARDQAATGVVPDNGVSTPKIVDGAVTDAKVAAAAGIAQSKIAGLVPDLAKKADLDSSGKILQAQLPALALTEHLGVVTSQSAMLALVGQRGDWCTRTDLGTDWQLVAEPSSVLASWRQHTYPASPVSSVAGRTGPITLSAADITDTTATGRAVMKATDASVARDVLGAYQKPASGIPSADIADGAVDFDQLSDIEPYPNTPSVKASVGFAQEMRGAYLSSGGWERGTLTQDVQDDLAKAQTAVQGSANGTPTAFVLWVGTEAEYNTATSNGTNETPGTVYLRGA